MTGRPVNRLAGELPDPRLTGLPVRRILMRNAYEMVTMAYHYPLIPINANNIIR